MFLVILVVVAAMVVAGAIWGKQYYENRYVGADYYAMVPLDYDMTSEIIYQMDGKTQEGTGVNYELTAYSEQGETKAVEFTVMGDDSTKYPQPGTFLKISASEQLVLSWSVIEESNVPEEVLEKIRSNS